jgi:hypothetical protein
MIQFRHRGKRKDTSLDILLHYGLVEGTALAADSICTARGVER